MSPSPYIFSPIAESQQVKHFGVMVEKNFQLPQQLGEILYLRGFDTLDAVDAFLHPQLSMLPQPEQMKDMDKAVSLVLTAYQQGTPILIHGDYDVDGITSTTLLTAFFREIGLETALVVPNRMKERYGLSRQSIQRLLGQLSKPAEGGLLITVDCGISALDEVRYAREQHLQVIITDHHEPPASLPEADAIINPKQRDCPFPFTQLAGVGVAFFFVMALRKALTREGLLDGSRINLKKYLDLVSLGTVADVVPLVDTNRILVRAGLEVLSEKKRPGILALCERCGIADRDILTEDISFKLAPRINASGRLGAPLVALNLLLSETAEAAQDAAKSLDQFNDERRALEGTAYQTIEPICRQEIAQGMEGLVIYQPGCHPGVLGIVASRIAEQFHRPVIIFTDEQAAGKGTLKGSGRSIPGIHLFELLKDCEYCTGQYGGHAMAIGLTIDRKQLPMFTKCFNEQVMHCGGVQAQGRGITIDYQFTERKFLTRSFARALQWLQPFGEGNPEPTFLLCHEQLMHPKTNNGHLRFQVHGNGCVFSGIGFRLAQNGHNYQAPHDLVFHLKRSWFHGVEQEQIQATHVLSF